MRATRHPLAKMHLPYALEVNGAPNTPTFFAASEARGGKVVVLSGPEYEAVEIPEHPGGCMGILSMAPAGLSGMLLVEDFVPLYDAAASGAALYTRSEAGPSWQRRRVFDIPFLHRVTLVKPWGEPLLLAAQLCRSKSAVDDWSQPGAVYAVRPDASRERWKMEGCPILDGLHRNHGLFVGPNTEMGEVFVAADEGLFRIWKPGRDTAWMTERLWDFPTSDLWMFDLDGDGELEITTIHPFHGDRAGVFKRIGGIWECVWETAGAFGHVVWAGQLAGQRGVLLGWRRGSQSLDFHVLAHPGSWRFERHRLDEGVGPLNVRVIERPGLSRILATHEATGEVVLYSLNSRQGHDS